MIEQGSKEWFEQRKGRVTGSIVGAILGHAPYMTLEDVLRRMVRDTNGLGSEFLGNQATAWGIANEPGAIAEFTMETGFPVKPASFVKYEDWAGASPDGYVKHGGLLEVKCPYKFRKDFNPKFASALEQPHYYDQMQFQMLCTGEKVCHFYQWATHGSRHEVVKFDQDWVEKNLPLLREFYDLYLSEVGNSDHLKEKRLVIDSTKAKKLVDEYDELTEAEDRAKQRKTEVLAELVSLANGHNAVVAGRNLTCTKREGIISYAKAVKDMLPDADLSKYKGQASEFWRLF